MMNRGFSLLEILVVIAIIAALGAATLPYASRSYKHYVKTVETKNIISVLRRAETMAMANAFESNFGVKFTSSAAILFKGNSYATHDAAYDETYPISNAVSVSAPSEIVFEKITGRPAAAISLSVSSNGKNQMISVGKEGTIDW